MLVRGWLESIRHDARYALTAIKRSPATTAVAIATLAIGIGNRFKDGDRPRRELRLQRPRIRRRWRSQRWRRASLRPSGA